MNGLDHIKDELILAIERVYKGEGFTIIKPTKYY